jgi:Amt family ammonium transporter
MRAMARSTRVFPAIVLAAALLAATPALALAAPDKGDTSFMLVSTILVLLMILPGLALFYGGLVRVKNMVSMLSQMAAVVVIGIVVWALWGYSLAFSDGGPLDLFIGGLKGRKLGRFRPAASLILKLAHLGGKVRRHRLQTMDVSI